MMMMMIMMMMMMMLMMVCHRINSQSLHCLIHGKDPRKGVQSFNFAWVSSAHTATLHYTHCYTTLLHYTTYTDYLLRLTITYFSCSHLSCVCPTCVLGEYTHHYTTLHRTHTAAAKAAATAATAAAAAAAAAAATTAAAAGSDPSSSTQTFVRISRNLWDAMDTSRMRLLFLKMMVRTMARTGAREVMETAPETAETSRPRPSGPG